MKARFCVNITFTRQVWETSLRLFKTYFMLVKQRKKPKAWCQKKKHVCRFDFISNLVCGLLICPSVWKIHFICSFRIMTYHNSVSVYCHYKTKGKARYHAIKPRKTLVSKHSSESCHFFSLVLALSFKTSKALLKLVNF